MTLQHLLRIQLLSFFNNYFLTFLFSNTIYYHYYYHYCCFCCSIFCERTGIKEASKNFLANVKSLFERNRWS